MEWRDEGIILGVRRHGEGSVIVETMTLHHGRHMGMVRGGRSAAMRAMLQPGNSVEIAWRARIEDHLGNFALQCDRMRAARLMESPVALNGLQLLAAHLRLLPERDPHAGLYRAALFILDHLDDPQMAARLLIRFELAMLDELGFGLDLARCAATGSTEDLVWVSPRSGRAVSGSAGAPWAPKLLVLPPFLAAGGSEIAASPGELADGFALSAFFLGRDVWEPRNIRPPDSRSAFIAGVLRELDADRPAR